MWQLSVWKMQQEVFLIKTIILDENTRVRTWLYEWLVCNPPIVVWIHSLSVDWCSRANGWKILCQVVGSRCIHEFTCFSLSTEFLLILEPSATLWCDESIEYSTIFKSVLKRESTQMLTWISKSEFSEKLWPNRVGSSYQYFSPKI